MLRIYQTKIRVLLLSICAYLLLNPVVFADDEDNILAGIISAPVVMNGLVAKRAYRI